MPSQLGAVWAETHCCLHQWCWSTSPPCAQSQPLCPWLLSKACKAYAASGRGIITPAYCTSPPPAAGSTVPAPDAWPWRWAWADRSPPRTAQSARARPSPGNTTWQYVCGVPNDVGNGTTKQLGTQQPTLTTHMTTEITVTSNRLGTQQPTLTTHMTTEITITSNRLECPTQKTETKSEYVHN